jgi:hypothetical protein
MVVCKYCEKVVVWRQVEGRWWPFDPDGIGHLRTCPAKVMPKGERGSWKNRGGGKHRAVVMWKPRG